MTNRGSFSSPASPGTSLEPGDRFELTPAPTNGALLLPDFFQTAPVSLGKLEDESGRPLAVQWKPAEKFFVVPDLVPSGSRPHEVFWLEYQGQDRFRLLVE